MTPAIDEKAATTPVATAPAGHAASMTWIGWFGAGLAGLLAVVASFVILPEGQLLRGPDPGDGMTSRTASPEQVHAERIRKCAYDACHEEAWITCVAGLDEARTLDPAGDDAVPVKDARRAAAVATASGTLRH